MAGRNLKKPEAADKRSIMNRRNVVVGTLLTMAAPALAQGARETTIFRTHDPAEILHRYVALLRAQSGSGQLNADMAALAAHDPVALWIAIDAVAPEGANVDIVERADRTVAVTERLRGSISGRDRERILTLHEAAEQNRADGHAAAMALAEDRDAWFDADRFFDQIEAVSRNLPPVRAEGEFDTWAAWRVPIVALSLAMGYEGHRPIPPEGEADAAMVTPWLFGVGDGLSETLARRFESSAIADSLLLAWLYVPDFEVYLAYGDLPASLPDAVAAASPRLDGIYRSVNARQMAEFAALEEEMMQ